MFRQIGTVAVTTWLWQHRGTVIRGVDFAKRLPDLVSERRTRDAMTEVKALVALDGKVPTSSDVRIIDVESGAVILRGDLDLKRLDVACKALLRVSDVYDVRTGGSSPLLPGSEVADAP